MQIVIDTSAIIAVLINERHRRRLIVASAGAELLAPPSVNWEVGNAFSAMFKRRRISLRQALRAAGAYKSIPIRFSEVELGEALKLSDHLSIYAYDAYVIVCALNHRCPVMSLDGGLLDAAASAGADIVEVDL